MADLSLHETLLYSWFMQAWQLHTSIMTVAMDDVWTSAVVKVWLVGCWLASLD